jgi:hypothetical protein
MLFVITKIHVRAMEHAEGPSREYSIIKIISEALAGLGGESPSHYFDKKIADTLYTSTCIQVFGNSSTVTSSCYLDAAVDLGRKSGLFN